MGTGVFSNVYVPRLMQEIEGDFTVEAVLDYRSGLTKAGGILVYQDDHTLVRLGVGIQFDGEITLTVKSPEQGFFVTARGLLEAENIVLRLARQQNRFTAWCSDGNNWYKCGQANVKMNNTIEAGVFAECTYRNFSLQRCTATPVRFRAVRVKKSNGNFR
jgi:regulation of enolase protein 1 (concanavalin A-like superfamily)